MKIILRKSNSDFTCLVGILLFGSTSTLLTLSTRSPNQKLFFFLEYMSVLGPNCDQNQPWSVGLLQSFNVYRGRRVAGEPSLFWTNRGFVVSSSRTCAWLAEPVCEVSPFAFACSGLDRGQFCLRRDFALLPKTMGDAVRVQSKVLPDMIQAPILQFQRLCWPSIKTEHLWHGFYAL